MHRMIATLTILCSVWASGTCAKAQDSDDLHKGWHNQLARYVTYTADGGASSEVNYSQWKRDEDRLRQYVDRLARVSRDEYEAWDTAGKLAFLINAYNAHTVLLVLQHHSDISSIKDIGGWFSSPWSLQIADLLGKKRTLDDIEHGMIRGRIDELKKEGFNGFSEPRIHFAVNCASRSCPPLRNEAYTAKKLDVQLEDQTQQFLGNRRQNAFDGRVLHLSSIFKWYEQDFSSGWRGISSLEALVLEYAEALQVKAPARQALRNHAVKIKYKDYDWALNDKAN
ncbi:DUF547 domain-containing protein [Salinimonas sp. HHU 13199]|uniref:DUF547 domain-containing protein n=1 Tax=Salinimonas profundi TaxID=2729140 RepID=A0ABR8LEX0_9ALTE|nr:DUF547 domain-containing protein [Salinimonas profundi]MBD3584819.1 DUF547 domain-containing protein [Salinimonas profundi]